MKIVIIGLSSSGKTTLAKTISSAYHIPCLHLDETIFKFYGRKRRKRVPSRTYIPQIKHFVSRKNWIVEGMFPFEFLFQKADYIIWMKPPMFRLLWQQWKRYVKDKGQRKRYGFISNLKLCRFNIDIRLNRQGITVEDHKPRLMLRDIENLLENTYRDKVIIIENPTQKKVFLEEFIHSHKR